MGYNIQLAESTLKIPAKSKDEVFFIWCKINGPEFDQYKSGATYPRLAHQANL